jgi:hypothetical protein
VGDKFIINGDTINGDTSHFLNGDATLLWNVSPDVETQGSPAVRGRDRQGG